MIDQVQTEPVPQVETVSPAVSPQMSLTAFEMGNQNSVRRVQRAVGNQTMQRMFRSSGSHVQPEISHPGDATESAAETVAASIMSASPTTLVPATEGLVRHPLPNTGAPRQIISMLPSAGEPLDKGTRQFMESRLGYDLGSVHLHHNRSASTLAFSLNAKAFSTGTDIVFGEGQYAPATLAGQRLIAHELAHVALGHTGIQRRTDMEAEMVAERAERRRREAEERERRHQAWVGNVEQQFGRDLTNQSRTISQERERIDLALTAQRAAALDAAVNGQGWLNEALRVQGYSGPDLTQVKQFWGEALIAAETLKLSASTGTMTTDAELLALEAIPTFYGAVNTFAQAAEQAHRTRVEAENQRLDAEYARALADYNRREEMDRMSQGPIGEPGERAARGAQALMRGAPPRPPTRLMAPPTISGQTDPARTRLYRVETADEWKSVADDVKRIGNGFTTLVVASLPARSETRVGIEYLEQLEARLSRFEETNAVAMRIPAVFYPNDRTVNRTGENGQVQLAPEAIPWQFYLINTGVRSHEQLARSGGEWVLIDLTSSQRFENRAAASDFDSARLQQGDIVDPPVTMFSALNSRIRFPEGRLYFTLPSGTSYILETTEPWSLSDWLAAIGISLAAIALAAAVVATGGAAAPAAVAFYAGLGAAAASAGSTLASLHEKSEHGALTSSDVDQAMISIGIDIITAASMGLGRLVAAPATAARLGLTGTRYIALQRLTQVVRAGAIGGDLYQAYSLTSGLVQAFNAIQNQPNLTDEERSRMRAQLVRTALLSGVLLTVAIRGDISDFQAGRALRVSHVDADGALVVAHSAEPPAHAETPTTREHPDAPGAAAAAHATPHAQVTGTAHASSAQAGAGAVIGTQTHAVGVAGSGRGHDFYFCSDLCAPIVLRLEAIINVLPRNHPEREIFQGLLSRARGASRRLKRGELSQEDADAIARQIGNDVSRHSQQSELFAALMNTDPGVLASHGGDIRRRLSRALDSETTTAAIQDEMQAANSGVNRGRDPLAEPDTRSPIEMDILGGVDIRTVDRPSRGQQPIRFDVGNFSHSHAEALVPNLPRGLSKEVPVTLLDGTVGRADRVRFIYDADGDRIGAHVFEIKPNVGDNVARGQTQVQGYVDGLQAEINAALRAKGKAIPTSAPGGGPLYSGQVLTYNYDQMVAVLRALRASRRDAARLAEFEAIARQVFGTTP